MIVVVRLTVITNRRLIARGSEVNHGCSNKQTWRLTADLIADMKREIDEAREMVYDYILGEKSRDVSGNYSVGDEP